MTEDWLDFISRPALTEEPTRTGFSLWVWKIFPTSWRARTAGPRPRAPRSLVRRNSCSLARQERRKSWTGRQQEGQEAGGGGGGGWDGSVLGVYNSKLLQSHHQQCMLNITNVFRFKFNEFLWLENPFISSVELMRFWGSTSNVLQSRILILF